MAPFIGRSMTKGAVRPSWRNPQSGDKGGGLPVTVGSGANQARAALTATAGSGHVGGGPGLVDEDQPGGIKPALAALPFWSRSRHVRAGLLGGVRGFFLN